MKRWLLALLVGCVPAAGGPSRNIPSPPAVAARPARDGRPASPSELALVKRLMAETERLRGLTFRQPVDVSIEGKAAMRAYVERTIDRDLLDRARRRYVSLGAISPDLDVRALLVEVMEDELVGYYDPKEKRLAVRADIARALEQDGPRSLAWRATVVHELVHALQDQYFDLASKIDQVRSTDADDAFGALVEGDATLVMLGYTAELSGESMRSVVEQPDRILAALTRPPEQLTPALRAAPALLREPLLFRYREGAHFCGRLVRAKGWARVDDAQRSPPLSTRAIRNPDEFLRGARDYALALPPFPDARWTTRDEDVLGGLELGVFLGLDTVAAARVLEDWRGDRYQVLERDGALASFWSIELASKSSARLVASGLARLHDPARRIALDERRIWVSRGLDADTFSAAIDHVRRALTRRPTGDPLATFTSEH
ncbi:MAG TPA: hypothetical protein VI299_02930 [Polyangiales bacterium]